MISETGHFALILALALAVIQTLFPLWGAARGDQRLMALAPRAALLQFGCLVLAFTALTIGFLTSDFSLQLVADNSHTQKPLVYKIAGVWGNHEGSLLLWALILALYGAALAWAGQGLERRFHARALAFQGLIGAAFLAFLLFTSNPFTRLADPPFEGAGLNPLLQDIGLALHPPLLYLGYVGLSMPFSFAMAALLGGQVDALWARWVRPWALMAWAFLTLGIALGSWWAYYELGWGGYWFWDPVENASLMPWLLATALLHSALVVEKRESLKAWTVLLAILAFGFSLVGTFLVRSGVITSVHAFANDPARGVFILMILAGFTGGGLFLFAWRGAALQARGLFQPLSREGALIANNLLLTVAALVILLGTLWPLVAEALWARKLSVGAPFFNTAVLPFFAALALILPFGALLPWKRGRLAPLARALRVPLLLAAAGAGLAFALATDRSALGPWALFLSLWLIAGVGADLAQQLGQGGLRRKAARLWRLPGAVWGRAFAHGGLGLVVFAIGALASGTVEDLREVRQGDRFALGGYEILVGKIGQGMPGPNYTVEGAEITVYKNGRYQTTVFPEIRFYPAAGMPTVEAGIAFGFWQDIYVVLGEEGAKGRILRSYVKPFASWLWLGAVLMAFGGLLSLLDRRYRLGAPAGRKGDAL